MTGVEYVIYAGEAFTVEWYYNASGRSQALEYFEKLSTAQKRKFLKLAQVMREVGRIRL